MQASNNIWLQRHSRLRQKERERDLWDSSGLIPPRQIWWISALIMWKMGSMAGGFTINMKKRRSISQKAVRWSQFWISFTIGLIIPRLPLSTAVFKKEKIGNGTEKAGRKFKAGADGSGNVNAKGKRGDVYSPCAVPSEFNLAGKAYLVGRGSGRDILQRPGI